MHLGQLGGAQLSIEAAMQLLEGMTPAQIKEVEQLVDEHTADMRWVPNPGPQTTAYYCDADQVLYGGQAGGGKSQLLVGKALQRHKRSLILRRQNIEVPYLVDCVEEILGHRDGFNGQEKRWHLPGDQLIIFGGCQHPGDERKYKGEPKDFIGIDEASEFAESQIDYVIQWLRSPDPKQRVQLLLATNPPDGIKGQWVTRWFAPWVDPDHPLYPQPSGKILYFKRAAADVGMGNEFEWSDEPFEIYDPRTGRTTRALTRTFIRSTLEDNPDYARTDYADRMAQGSEENRARYERGEFVVEPEDHEYQVIPTRWVRLAQERWKAAERELPGPPLNMAMTAMGCDIAMGGKDRFIIAKRWGEWYDVLSTKPGKETPTPNAGAGFILSEQRDGAQINIDMGGGYGSGVLAFLKANGRVAVYGFVPSGSSMGKSACKKYKFRNLRAEAYWRFREALDPDGPYRICLPPDPELKQELCTHRRRELGPGGMITIQEKSEVIDDIGRSPDKADAVVIAWFTGRQRHVQSGGAYPRAPGSPGGPALQTRTNQDHRSAKRDRYTARGSNGPNRTDSEQG